MQNVTKEFIEFINNPTTNFFDYSGVIDATVLDVNINKKVEYYRLNIAYISFKNCHFKGLTLWQHNWECCTFEDCIFEQCSFQSTVFFECDLINTNFIKLSTGEIKFLETVFQNVKFHDCYELYDTLFSSCTFNNLSLEKTTITACNVKTFTSNSDISISFSDSVIFETVFRNTDLSKALFNNCDFQETIFTNCKLVNENITKCHSDGMNYIDLQTIIHSSLQEENLQLFGVKNSFAKDYINELVTEAKFQSVFISYSFNDSQFARHLNEKLRQKGVSTFLWEHDAPGGKKLKKIMRDYIQKYDRVLFIASENSLKSEACHFELKESRERQNKEWKDIYYPIHIDDYLFKLSKEDIPKVHREEFWANIEEIKEFHSVDFSPFITNYKNNNKYEAKVSTLAKDLLL